MPIVAVLEFPSLRFCDNQSWKLAATLRLRCVPDLSASRVERIQYLCKGVVPLQNRNQAHGVESTQRPCRLYDMLSQVTRRSTTRQFISPFLQHADPLLFAVMGQHLLRLRQESMIFSNQFRVHRNSLLVPVTAELYIELGTLFQKAGEATRLPWLSSASRASLEKLG